LKLIVFLNILHLPAVCCEWPRYVGGTLARTFKQNLRFLHIFFNQYGLLYCSSRPI